MGIVARKYFVVNELALGNTLVSSLNECEQWLIVQSLFVALLKLGEKSEVVDDLSHIDQKLWWIDRLDIVGVHCVNLHLKLLH